MSSNQRIRSMAVCLALVLVTLCSRSAPAEYFRSDQGRSESRAVPLPGEFSNPRAVAWKIALDPGHSTPIVSGGRVYLTGYRPATRELLIAALDSENGKLLWERTIKPEKIEQTHSIGNPATATPIFDGERLVVYFGSYGLQAYDREGALLWEQRMGPFQDEYGAGSSPILLGDKIILNQDHDIDSFLAAYDRKSGRLIWKVARPDAVRSYSTPVPWIHDGRTDLLVAGALELAGYDPANGKKRWWVNGLARIVIPTPIPAGDRIFMASWAPGGDTGRRIGLDAWPAALGKWDKNADKKLARQEIDDREVLDRFYRIDLDQNGVLDENEWDRHANVFRLAQNQILAIQPKGEGDLTASAIQWKYSRGVPYVATPLVERGIVWMVKEGGIVTKLDAENGSVLQEERIAGIGNYFASAVTDGRAVYFASEPGVVSAISAEREWKPLSSHEFHERIYATPVIRNGRLYVRTEKALYCFGSANGSP